MDTILKEIFDDSLDTLGIDQTRYINLPFHLMKTNLSFDIYNTVSGFIKNFPPGSVDFSSKEIYDFSEDEIDVHLKIFNASLALSCLGNYHYVKPLINYLNFPEARWSIKIDFLLQRMIGKNIHTLSIPTYHDILNYQSIFIKEYFYTNLNNFSQELLIRNNGTFFLSQFNHKTENLSFEEKRIRLKDWIEPTMDEIKCSEYYYISASRFLTEKKIDSFISWFNDSISNQRIAFFNTISETLIDVFDDLDIDAQSDFWVRHLKKKRISPLASVIFYKIIYSKNKEKGLANRFVSEFIGKNLSHDLNNALETIFECSPNSETISNIGFLLIGAADLPHSTKSNIEKIIPLFTYCIGQYVSNLYISELESLNLVYQKDKHGKERLYELFVSRFEQTNEILYQLKYFGTEWKELKELLIKIRVLLGLREEFLNIFLYDRKSISRNLKGYYISLFKSWIDETYQVAKEE